MLIRERLKLFFAQLILLVSSVFYGAVSDLCEECKACHVRTGRLALAGQSDPLFEPTSSLMETPTPLTDDPAQEDQLQKYQERVERLSQQIRVIKFCTDAGFLTTVEVGQYFMTKDTEECSQFTVIQWLVVSTLCQEMKNPLTRMVGFEGTPKLCPYWKSQPATYKVHMEWKIRIWVCKQRPFSLVGQNFSWPEQQNKEDDHNEQETSEMQFEDYALKTNALAFASRSKAKAKPRRRISACSSTRTLPIGERKWTDIEPEDYSPIDYPVSKQLSTLLRHGDLRREGDGAIEFWRLKDYLRNYFVQSRHWSDEMWKSTMARGGGNKNKFQYCTDSSAQEILYLRDLQGHSGRNLIDPELQDNVLIPNNFFEYIYHTGCAINFTFHHKFRIDTGRTKLEHKTDGIL